MANSRGGTGGPRPTRRSNAGGTHAQEAAVSPGFSLPILWNNQCTRLQDPHHAARSVRVGSPLLSLCLLWKSPAGQKAVTMTGFELAAGTSIPASDPFTGQQTTKTIQGTGLSGRTRWRRLGHRHVFFPGLAGNYFPLRLVARFWTADRRQVWALRPTRPKQGGNTLLPLADRLLGRPGAYFLLIGTILLAAADGRTAPETVGIPIIEGG